MKVKDLKEWPPRFKPGEYPRAGRLTGVGLDQSQPEMLVLGIDVEGQTSFGVLHLDRALQRAVFVTLSEHTGETLGEVSEVFVRAGLREARPLKKEIWHGLLYRQLINVFDRCHSSPPEPSADGPK